jgi:hypothetical protein
MHPGKPDLLMLCESVSFGLLVDEKKAFALIEIT